MATRKQLFHPDDVKQKIKTSQLINRLTKHALSPDPIMDASQVNAAVKLINKVIPDLKAIEHTGEGGGPIQTQDVPAKEGDLIEQAKRLGLDPSVLGLSAGVETKT